MAKKAKCSACQDRGYRLVMRDGNEHWWEIQRCDGCMKLKDDNVATKRCYKDALRGRKARG